MQNPKSLISSFWFRSKIITLLRKGVAGDPLYCMQNNLVVLVLLCLLLLTNIKSVTEGTADFIFQQLFCSFYCKIEKKICNYPFYM